MDGRQRGTGRDDGTTGRQDDKTTRRQDDRMIGRQNDRTTIRQESNGQTPLMSKRKVVEMPGGREEIGDWEFGREQGTLGFE